MSSRTPSSSPDCDAPACQASAAEGAKLCREHIRRLRGRLAEVPGILTDLQITITRQDKLTEHAARAAETALSFNEHAANADARLRRQLMTTSHAVARRHTDERDPLWISASQGSAEVSRWLIRNLHTLAQLDAAGTHWAEIDSVTYRARLATDRPPIRTRFYVGPCPQTDRETGKPCPGEVWAVLPSEETDPAWLQCLTGYHKWDSTQWYRVGGRILKRIRQLGYPDPRG